MPSRGPSEAHRARSGSFNPNIFASGKCFFLRVPLKESQKRKKFTEFFFHEAQSPESCGLNRERSYSDVHNFQSPLQTLLRQRSCDGSSEECSVDLELVQCFLPTGMILDVSVHPDDSIFQIKQIMLNSATADGMYHEETFPKEL